MVKEMVTITGSLNMNQHITTVSVNEDTNPRLMIISLTVETGRDKPQLFNFKGLPTLYWFDLALLHAYNYGQRRKCEKDSSHT